MRILLLDNIDSFTYNIYHYLEGLGAEVTVIDHSVIEPEVVYSFDALVISPGPGLPNEAGKLMEVLAKAVSEKIPTLGVCLGMQAMAEYFGGTIFNQQEVKHGQQAIITHTNESILFKGIPAQFHVGLYHSWAVDKKLPKVLTATAFSEVGIMMALEHTSLPVYGVQFHPESILSEYGKPLFANFLEKV
ncbi:MAG: aminodeoxychorismate/anthranilate synthase component II [Fluviicola sp.]|nr:aminodeoxychorismate/anthranilate synthase component II [Fluviicola sp.]